MHEYDAALSTEPVHAITTSLAPLDTHPVSFFAITCSQLTSHGMQCIVLNQLVSVN